MSKLPMKRMLAWTSCVACLGGCASFDDFPEGDLCKNAPRDEQGRAIDYPEWKLCPPLPPSDGGVDQ